MSRYSIRRLHLATREALRAELGESHCPQLEAFAEQFRRYSWVLKIIARAAAIPQNLIAAFSLRGIACWMASSTIAYLFSEIAHFEDLARRRSFSSSHEEIFAAELRHFLDRQQRDHFVLRSPNRILEVGPRTLVMGILNCTPDSFSDGGRYLEKHTAIEHGLRMAEQGADIIDVGGESTRPAGTYGEGAKPVSEAEEMERVIPVIAALANSVQVMISIDTYKSSVAEAAIQAGAGMVNDISGFHFDPHMAEVVAHYRVPAVMMHIKGTPRDMQQNPSYENLLDELYQYFEQQLELARHAAIPHERIIIDPGLGFGKRLQDNYEILQRLAEFRGLGCPILVGPSRKAFIGKVLGLPVDERLEGTAAAVALAVAHGAHLVRVHDVREIHRVVRIADMIVGRSGPETFGGGA